MLNDYNKFISFYTKDIKGTGYLAFRDLSKFLKGKKDSKILDFGCGAGRSTSYLTRLGFTVEGVDLDPKMIEEAKKNVKKSRFHTITSATLPFCDGYFEHIFNSFVLFDFASKQEIKTTFHELKRVCKNNGTIISIVNSDYLFKKNWLTIDNKYPQNNDLKSGDIAKLYLKDINVEINDYFWSQDDYLDCFKSVGFKNIEIYNPLGNTSDPFKWVDEYKFPPYTIFICTI